MRPTRRWHGACWTRTSRSSHPGRQAIGDYPTSPIVTRNGSLRPESGMGERLTRAATSTGTGVGRHAGDGLSGLAPDVRLAGLVDQVGALLAVTDQPSEQRRAKTANTAHAFGGFRPAHTCRQTVDESFDLHVLAGQPSPRTGRSRRGRDDPAVQPIRTLSDVDVLTKVPGQLDQRNVHALDPGADAVVCGGGQRLRSWTRAARRDAHAAPPTWRDQAGGSWVNRHSANARPPMPMCSQSPDRRR